MNSTDGNQRASTRPQPPLVGTDEDPNEVVIGRVICEGGTPNMERVQFRILPERNTAIGRIVGIRSTRQSGESILTLLRVDQMREHNPHEDAESSTITDVIPFETRYSPEGRSTVIYRAATGELLEELVLAVDGTLDRIESPETLPLSGSPVVEVPSEFIAEALSFASSPDDGLDLGAIRGLDVHAILHKDVIQTHMFLAGGIGRGKSYARGVIAEELTAHGVPQLNIDPMGEMVEATEDLGGINVIPGEGFQLPLSALEAEDVLDAIPGINKSTNIATLIAYAHNSLLTTKVIGRGEYFGVAELVQHIEKVAPRLEMAKPNTLNPAIQRANSLRHIDFIGEPFPWERHLVPGRIINIDCRGRRVSELRLVAASVARDIQRLAKARKIPFVVVSIDEAHLIAPNQEDVVTTQVLREIARIGRHYRIGLILTTQSPSDMDRSVLKRLLTRLIFAIEPDQLDALRGLFADAPESVVRYLPKLPQGTAILTGVSETVKHATVIDIRKRLTRVGGQTPNIFDDLKDRGWDGRKSLEEIRTRNNKD